jgi:putative DNA primase/helicase
LISAPLEVLGACRDPQGCAWGKQLRFRDADNRMHMRHVSDAALRGEPAALCATLAHEGLRINRSKQREFAEYLSGVGVDTRVTIVNRTGWHEVGGHPVFTLPKETIPTSIGEWEARGALED